MKGSLKRNGGCEVDGTDQRNHLQNPFVCGNAVPCMLEMGELASKWGEAGRQTVVAGRLE